MYRGIKKEIIIDYISSKNYLILLLLMLFSSCIFTSFNPITSDYIQNINYSLTMHKSIYTFIVFPILSMSVMNLYNKFTQNTSFLLRIKNKNEYFKIQLKYSIILTTVIFLQFILTVFISIHINRSIEIVFNNDEYYNVINILVLFVNIFKVYMNFIIVQFITLLSMNTFKTKTFSLIISFVYILFVHFSYKLEFVPLIKYIIPSSNFYSYNVFNNLLFSFIMSFVYYIILSILLILSIKKKIIKNSVEKEVLK